MVYLAFPCKRHTQGNVYIVYLFLYNEAICNKQQNSQNESVVATILVIQAMLAKNISDENHNNQVKIWYSAVLHLRNLILPRNMIN